MKAAVGDKVMVTGHHVGEPSRDAVVLEVRGPDGEPPYRVWQADDGHEGLFFPGSDATIVNYEHAEQPQYLLPFLRLIGAFVWMFRRTTSKVRAVTSSAGRAARNFDRFDRMYDEWTREFPFRWPLFATRWTGAGMIPVDEYRDDGTLVVRAELPGIDPETDVEVTVSDNTLHIAAERKEEEKVSEKGYLRHEVRYGTLTRTLPLPEGVTEADITANYKDGILEIRIPIPEVEVARKIPVTKS